MSGITTAYSHYIIEMDRGRGPKLDMSTVSTPKADDPASQVIDPEELRGNWSEILEYYKGLNSVEEKDLFIVTALTRPAQVAFVKYLKDRAPNLFDELRNSHKRLGSKPRIRELILIALHTRQELIDMHNAITTANKSGARWNAEIFGINHLTFKAVERAVAHENIPPADFKLPDKIFINSVITYKCDTCDMTMTLTNEAKSKAYRFNIESGREICLTVMENPELMTGNPFCISKHLSVYTIPENTPPGEYVKNNRLFLENVFEIDDNHEIRKQINQILGVLSKMPFDNKSPHMEVLPIGVEIDLSTQPIK